MSEFIDAYQRALKESLADEERFRAVALRLLRHGVIAAKDSQHELALYSDCLRLKPLLDDYFHILGCRLHHDVDYQYFRLYPPGAGAPGQVGADAEEVTGLRLKLTYAEIAAAIAVCFLYDKARQDGRLDDEGEVVESLETFHTAMQTTLKRSLPDGAVERKSIFHRLKQMKIIGYDHEADLNDPETVIVLRPFVTSLVYPDAVNIIEAALPPDNDDEVNSAASNENGDETDVHG